LALPKSKCLLCFCNGHHLNQDISQGQEFHNWGGIQSQKTRSELEAQVRKSVGRWSGSQEHRTENSQMHRLIERIDWEADHKKGFMYQVITPAAAFILLSPYFQISGDSDTATLWTRPSLGFLERGHIPFHSSCVAVKKACEFWILNKQCNF